MLPRTSAKSNKFKTTPGVALQDRPLRTEGRERARMTMREAVHTR